MSTFAYTLKTLSLRDGRVVHYYSLPALEEAGVAPMARLPFSIRVVLESLIRL